MRRLRLISSVPDLQMWINLHPLRSDNNAPLFVTSRRYSGNTRHLDLRTVENKLNHVAEALHITKPVHPHAIRHARLTDLARSIGGRQGLNEMELRLVAGWERNSAMLEVYVYLSGANVERKVLEKAGVLADEKSKPETTLEPVKCPRCGIMNSHYSQYCSQCFMALNKKAAMKVDESVDKAQKSQDYQNLINQIRSRNFLMDRESGISSPGSSILRQMARLNGSLEKWRGESTSSGQLVRLWSGITRSSLIRVSIMMSPAMHSGIVSPQSESSGTFRSGSLCKHNSGYHNHQNNYFQ